jgi:hypothetical protein
MTDVHIVRDFLGACFRLYTPLYEGEISGWHSIFVSGGRSGDSGVCLIVASLWVIEGKLFECPHRLSGVCLIITALWVVDIKPVIFPSTPDPIRNCEEGVS